MNISAPEELAQPILTAEAIRQTLPQVCLKDDGSAKSEGSIKNILAGFNQMLKVGLLQESRLSVQMESEFQLTLQHVREHAKLHNKTQWPSFLNDVRVAANQIINFDTSKMTLAQTLTVLAGKEFGVSLSKTKLSESLHKLEASVSAETYYNWMSGKNVPRLKRTTDAVLSLDNKLNVHGALRNKVKKSFIINPESDDDNVEKIPFVLPSLLKKEMGEYIDFRVNDNKPKKMPYLDKVVLESKEEKRKLKVDRYIDNTVWTKRTATLFEAQVIFFAKYIEEEHPKKFEDMSLSSLFNTDFFEGLEKYIYKKGTLSFGLKLLTWVTTECKKNSYASVFLHSNDDFCADIDDWIEELELLNRELQKIFTDMKKVHKKSILDGARHVEWILEKEESTYCVNTISKGLWYEAEHSSVPIGPTIAAMMFDLLLPCPIRGTNVSDLRWLGTLSLPEIRKLHKTETCALYFDEYRKRYTIFVHKEKLKNSQSTTINSIIQPLQHLSDKFTKYLSVREEYVKSRGWVTDTLFPMMKIARKIKKSRLDKLGNIVDFTLGKDGVYGLLTKATKATINTYFPEENVSHGINPHAMRHLAASLFLRDNPENYTALATLLMDNLETVTRIYARRDDLGNHEKISNWAGGLVNAA